MAKQNSLTFLLPLDLHAWMLTAAQAQACTPSEYLRILLGQARQADREQQALALHDRALAARRTRGRKTMCGLCDTAYDPANAQEVKIHSHPEPQPGHYREAWLASGMAYDEWLTGTDAGKAYETERLVALAARRAKKA